MSIKIMLWIIWVFFGLFGGCAYGQVCSPIGQLCTRTTDCCKGCCEAHSCVDRPYPCSSDLVPQPGYNSCERYYCPVGHICYLREVCPPENPCPPHPNCRRVDVYNYTDRGGYYRNSANNSKYQFSTVLCLQAAAVFILISMRAHSPTI